ncbi:MAG TPA: hypothetical protein ENJ09_02425 [Planctomycetes bacterium]|nr:hypothetical protein [Planctomycetota bacterium]
MQLSALLLSFLLGVWGGPGAGAAARCVQEGEEAGAVEQGEVVRNIEVVGNQRYTARQMISALGVQVGQPLDPEEVDRGIRSLFETFHVRAELQQRPSTDPSGGVDLRLVVEELPFDLRPRFIGNVDISDSDLLEWAGLREEEELFLFQAPRIRSRLLSKYRAKGYYFVEVNIVEREAGVDEATGRALAPDVIFEIKEGPKVRVRAVKVHGNETLPDRRFMLFFRRGLRKLAQTKLGAPGLFGLFPDAFVQEDLDADVIAMREVYRDLGYLDAIVEVSRLEFSRDRSWVTIHIAVDEGGRYTVGSIEIEGIERFRAGDGSLQERPADLIVSEEKLRSLLELKVGGIYERRLHRDDEKTLRRFYGDRGYLDEPSLGEEDRWSFLTPELTFEADRPVVHVTYRIAQGHRIFIREIPIIGNLHTQDRVIRRLITVKPGQQADSAEIEKSRQRIQSTGWFSDQFDINHREPSYRFVDTGDPNWKDLEFTIEEGQVLTFNLAGGVSSNTGAFGTIGLTMDNFDVSNLPTSFWTTLEDVAARRAFHGAGQTLRIRASPGTQRSFFDISFSEPDLFADHENRISLGLNARKTIRIYRSHDEERRQYGFRLGRSLSQEAAIFGGFQTGSVDVSDIDGGGEPGFNSPLSVPEDLKAQEGKTDLVHVLLGYRYTSIDDRLNTRNGIEFNFENQIYDESLGSDVNFVKSQVSFDWWNELDDDPTSVSPFYHLQIAAGVATPYGGTDEVPYTERFFLGGLRTLRGYRFRGVGPNEADFPIGGQTMLHGTLEYRFPVVKQIQPGTYREYESIQAGAFFDWGVLDPEDFRVDTGELRATAGFLFGITKPLPITFSFGWPVITGEGDAERVFAFNIGLR